MDQQEQNDRPCTSSLNDEEARHTTQEEMDDEIKAAAKRTRAVPSVATSTRVYYEPQPTRNGLACHNANSPRSLDQSERDRKMAAIPDSALTTSKSIADAPASTKVDIDTMGSSRTGEALQKDDDDLRELSDQKNARGRNRAKISQQQLTVSMAGPTYQMRGMDNSAQSVSSRGTSPVPPNTSSWNHSLENSARSHGSGRSQSPLPQPKAKKLPTSVHGLSNKSNSKSPPSTRGHSPVPPGARRRAISQHGLSRDNSQTQVSDKGQRQDPSRENANSPPTSTTKLHNPSATAILVASDHTTLPSLQSRRAAYESKFRPSSASSISSTGDSLRVSQFTLHTGSNHGSENEVSVNPLGSAGELLEETIMVPPEEDLKRQARQERSSNAAIEDATSPGAYAEGGDGTHLVRNRNLRFSLVGLGTPDLETGGTLESPAALRTGGSANDPTIIHGDDETDQTDPDDISIEASGRQSSTTPSGAGLVEALPVVDPSVLVADAQQVGSTELQRIANKEEVNDRRAFRKAASLTICGLLVLVAIMLIVCFEVILRPSSDEKNIPSGPPTPAPTPFLFEVPRYTADAILESSGTAQAQAYRWLKMDPNLGSYPAWRLQQRFALATLWFATTTQDLMASDGTVGHGWRNEKSWLLYEEHECDWYADSTIALAFITVRMTSPCTDDGRYERLWLQENDLHGTLPPEISLMTSLSSIALIGNKLDGTVPPQVWQLPSLKHLMLTLNLNITGTIPSEIGLTDLEFFAAQYTSMTGSIPSEIGNLTDLNTLALDGNKLNGAIPSEVGLLPKIQYLLLTENNLTDTVPSEIGMISSLRYFKLNDNSLTGPIPTELGLLPKLFYLNFDKNRLTGTLPRELFYPGVQEMILSSNSLTGPIPTEIGLMKKQSFHVDGNRLSGTLPSEVGLLHDLTELIVFNNSLTGSLPTEVGGLRDLENLAVHQNGFNGTLPSEIGLMPELWVLSLSENNITGSLPSQVGELTALSYLNVSHCAMTGLIPSDIGRLTGLRWLYLQKNDFSAPLPAEISLLGNLSDFQWST